MKSISLTVGQHQLNLLVNQQGDEHYVALRPLCDALGLDWSSQWVRTKKNPQFRMRCDITTYDTVGRQQEMACIPVSQIGMWLCTINARRVSEHVRPQLLAFQEHLQVVIHDHLCGRLSGERMMQLEALVKELFALVQAQQRELEQLKKQLDAQDYLSGKMASNAGRHLAARKQTLKILQ